MLVMKEVIKLQALHLKVLWNCVQITAFTLKLRIETPHHMMAIEGYGPLNFKPHGTHLSSSSPVLRTEIDIYTVNKYTVKRLKSGIYLCYKLTEPDIFTKKKKKQL